MKGGAATADVLTRGRSPPTMSTRTTTIRTRQLTRAISNTQDSSVLSDEKENVNMNGTSGKAKATKRGAKTYCLCKKVDDGSPMIHCSSCKDWCVPSSLHPVATSRFANDLCRRYHFRCVDLSERDAEEIRESSPILLQHLAQAHSVFDSESYVCPPCHEKTGARTLSEYFVPPIPVHLQGPRRGPLCCYRCSTHEYDTWLSSHLLAWTTICSFPRYRTYTPRVRPRW